MIASFNRFDIEITRKEAESCSHSGQCYADVTHLAPKIREKNNKLNNDDIRAELKGYGAWADEELLNIEANWKRIVWIAAGNIMERSRL